MVKIFSKLKEELINGKDMMLVTVTDVSGSAPRGAGAMMLCDKDGIVAGTVGGGPAEAVAIDMSKELVLKGQSATHDFRLYQNEKYDIGSVCGGEIAICLLFAPGKDSDYIALCDDIIDRVHNHKKGILTIYLDGKLPTVVDGDAKSYELREDSFSLPIYLGERCFIFGAGHVSKALCPVLASVGFKVTVCDDRESLLTREMFPNATDLMLVDYEKVSEMVDVNEDDYVAIMTAGHVADYTVELQMIRKNPAYIGVIGSRSKIGVVREKLKKDGISEEMIDRVHTPIGIKIHSISPEEVAVSIAAEMINERYEYRLKTGRDVEKRQCIK